MALSERKEKANLRNGTHQRFDPAGRLRHPSIFGISVKTLQGEDMHKIRGSGGGVEAGVGGREGG